MDLFTDQEFQSVAPARRTVRSGSLGDCNLPLYLTNYVIEPWPGVFVVKILAWELFAVSSLGVLAARLAKNDSVASARSAIG